MSNKSLEQCCNHNIVLENIDNKEVFTYSIVLCRGHVENTTQSICTPNLAVTSTSNSQKDIEISLKGNNFKCLLELENGSNLYTFVCCSSSFTITIVYEENINFLTVLPLYIVCKGHNGHFQAPKTEENTPESACKRITTACKLLQSILADKLREFKLKPKTFTLESNCHIFYSNLDAASTYKMTQIDLWYYFAREIMSSDIGHSNRKYIAFLSCTVYEGTDYFDDMSYEEVLDLVKGYVAYGGDGLALLSTACLYTWPETPTEIYARFNDFELVDRTQFMDDSCYRGTLSGCFATTLGAALHELCHTFNLGHTETGIMGCDFGNTQNIFLANTQLQRFSRLRYRNDLLKSNGDYMELLNSSLAILYYHKWFNPYSKQARKCTFKYDSANKVVRSTAGIRVIEIRREIDSMVLKSWTFVDKVLKFSFSVFEDVKNLENSIILYVVDDGGNIFTEPICS